MYKIILWISYNKFESYNEMSVENQSEAKNVIFLRYS